MLRCFSGDDFWAIIRRIMRKEINVAQRRHIIVMNEAGHPPFYMEFKHEDSWGLQVSLRDFSDAER